MRDPDLAELLQIEQGEPLGKELAVDHSLAETWNDPETDAARKLIQSRSNATEIVRFDVLQAIPQHDPVDALAGLLGALGAAVPDQLGIEAGPGDLVILRVDLTDEVEIDEAVVHRSDERVGAKDRGPGDRVVAPGSVDDDHVGFRRKPLDSGREAAFAVILKDLVNRMRKIVLLEAPHRGVAILEVARHGPLAAVEVERSDPVARSGEGNRGVHRSRRFAGAALFVGEDDEVRLLGHDLIFSPGASKRPRGKFIRGAGWVQRVRGREELALALAQLRRAGTLALVPTMGALHAGHMALVDEAKRRADKVAATIFVNPTQFGAGEDFGRYPRQEDADADLLAEHGCDLLWLPPVEDIYPDGFATTIRVAEVSERWEGEARPGHFDGVATVVAKLLLSVRPDVAMFGEKDFQQLAVIRRMAADLDLGVEIAGVATVRDPDGLALSSRNAYLSADERKRAIALPEALNSARAAIIAGEPVSKSLDEARNSLRNAGFSRVDYVALVDSETLEPLDHSRGEMRLIAAATIGKARLIDNLAV